MSLHSLLYRLYRKLLRPDPLNELVRRGLTVGQKLQMQEGAVIDHSHCWLITIGDNVTLAPRSHILAHDASTKLHLDYTRIGKVVIGNRVFVGAGAIVLPGVTIGDNSVIGAGSVVTRDVPSNVVAAGAPARTLCTLDEFLSRHKEAMEKLPCFDDTYTIERNITDTMKKEMADRIETYGYVV